MNITDFTTILQHQTTITHEQTEGVKSIIKEFPYFQSARALYLKGLKNQGCINYNQELKITAAHTTDRSVLFDYITSDTFVQNEISKFIKQNITHLKEIEVNTEDLSTKKNEQIDEVLKKQINDTEGVLDPDLFQPKNEIQKEISVSKNTITETKPIIADDILNLGKPLQFNKTEKHSFNEWLKITHFKPIERTEINIEKTISLEESLNKIKKFELIDKFISKNPKINPVKPVSQKGNLAKAQMIQPEALMTETLARIYVEQKNYKKAIQSYKILSLKYPEKSGFFANQIKAVEQLQEHNNNQ